MRLAAHTTGMRIASRLAMISAHIETRRFEHRGVVVEVNVYPVPEDAIGVEQTSAPTIESRGPYLLWVADENGRALNKPPDGSHPEQDRQDKAARDILFTINQAGAASTPDDMEVCDRTDRVLHALRHLYRQGDPSAEAQFRWFYTRLFGVARMALEERAFTAEISKRELAIVENDLIQDEGPAIKNVRVKSHLQHAAWLSSVAFAVYVLLRQTPPGAALDTWLSKFGSSALVAGNYTLLLLGCFIGVCLSYAFSKPGFRSVDDLVTPEADLLSPLIRLVLTATLSALLVMLAAVQIVDLSIGLHSLRSVAAPDAPPALPFVVGAICGIGEKLWPSSLVARAESLLTMGTRRT